MKQFAIDYADFSESGFTFSDAELAFERLKPLMEAVPDNEVHRPRVDVMQAVRAGIHNLSAAREDSGRFRDTFRQFYPEQLLDFEARLSAIWLTEKLWRATLAVTGSDVLQAAESKTIDELDSTLTTEQQQLSEWRNRAWTLFLWSFENITRMGRFVHYEESIPRRYRGLRANRTAC